MFNFVRTFFTLFLATPVFAEPLNAIIVDTAPYGIKMSDGSISGVYGELISLAQKDLEAGVTLMPFGRISAAIGQKESNFTFLFENEEIKKNADALKSYFSVETLLVSAPGTRITQLKSINATKVGRLRYGCKDLEKDPSIQPKFVTVTNFESGLKMLLDRRLQHLCLTQDSLDWALQNAKLTMTSFDNPYRVSQTKVYLYAAKSMTKTSKIKLIAAFDKVFSKYSISDIRELYLRKNSSR